jgi:hypothetical protein
MKVDSDDSFTGRYKRDLSNFLNQMKNDAAVNGRMRFGKRLFATKPYWMMSKGNSPNEDDSN